MIAITLDRELRAKLNGLNEHLQVQDESGLVVGHFLPDDLYMRLLYAWAREEFADNGERKLALAEPGGFSTTEVIAHIEKLIQEARESKS